MERDLPTITIEGTEFIINVNRLVLHEKDNLKNIIPFREMTDYQDGYRFEYSRKEKNIPKFWDNSCATVEIPEWVKLDPMGMAQKHQLRLSDLTDKNDFDLIVDRDLYDSRVSKGNLPTIDIAGHIFYVDMRMDKLRPKDDFSSNGIVFDDIDHYYSEETRNYIIPYNPKTKEFQELPDYDKIKEFPKDLIAVSFPFQRELDPIGWNRANGFDLKDDLKQIGLKMKFKAKIIPWEKTNLPQIIKDNLQRDKQLKETAKPTQKRNNSPKM